MATDQQPALIYALKDYIIGQCASLLSCSWIVFFYKSSKKENSRTIFCLILIEFKNLNFVLIMNN